MYIDHKYYCMMYKCCTKVIKYEDLVYVIFMHAFAKFPKIYIYIYILPTYC